MPSTYAQQQTDGFIRYHQLRFRSYFDVTESTPLFLSPPLHFCSSHFALHLFDLSHICNGQGARTHMNNLILMCIRVLFASAWFPPFVPCCVLCCVLYVCVCVCGSLILKGFIRLHFTVSDQLLWVFSLKNGEKCSTVSTLLQAMWHQKHQS